MAQIRWTLLGTVLSDSAPLWACMRFGLGFMLRSLLGLGAWAPASPAFPATAAPWLMSALCGYTADGYRWRSPPDPRG